MQNEMSSSFRYHVYRNGGGGRGGSISRLALYIFIQAVIRGCVSTTFLEQKVSFCNNILLGIAPECHDFVYFPTFSSLASLARFLLKPMALFHVQPKLFVEFLFEGKCDVFCMKDIILFLEIIQQGQINKIKNKNTFRLQCLYQ